MDPHLSHPPASPTCSRGSMPGATRSWAAATFPARPRRRSVGAIFTTADGSSHVSPASGDSDLETVDAGLGGARRDPDDERVDQAPAAVGGCLLGPAADGLLRDPEPHLALGFELGPEPEGPVGLPGGLTRRQAILAAGPVLAPAYDDDRLLAAGHAPPVVHHEGGLPIEIQEFRAHRRRNSCSMPSRHDWTLPRPQIVAAPAGHHRPLGWVWLPMLISRGVPQRARPRSRRSATRPSARTEPTTTTGKLAERGDRRQPAQVVLPHRNGEAAGRMVQVGERHRRSRARRLPLSDHELARSISDTPPASSKSRRRSGVTPPSGTPCTWTSRPRSATTMVTRRRTAEALTPRPGECLTRERACRGRHRAARPGCLPGGAEAEYADASGLG